MTGREDESSIVKLGRSMRSQDTSERGFDAALSGTSIDAFMTSLGNRSVDPEEKAIIGRQLGMYFHLNAFYGAETIGQARRLLSSGKVDRATANNWARKGVFRMTQSEGDSRTVAQAMREAYASGYYPNSTRILAEADQII